MCKVAIAVKKQLHRFYVMSTLHEQPDRANTHLLGEVHHAREGYGKGMARVY